jgi:hypothetical protein
MRSVRGVGWSALFVLAVLLGAPALEAQTPPAPTGPGQLELDTADHSLKAFEERVKLSEGKPIDPGSDGKDAMVRIKKLAEKFPNHPRVKDMVERMKVALKKSKGQTVDITPEMLAFRNREKELASTIAGITKEAWADYRKKVESAEGVLATPFPVPDPLKSDAAALAGKYVILDGFRYPENEFTNNGIAYVAVGSASTGFYYVASSSRAFLGAYEAIKRYRRDVAADPPGAWTVVGRLAQPRLMVPAVGESAGIMTAQMGFVVEPEAVYVPDLILAISDEKNPQGGAYAGEDKVEGLKAGNYSVKEIPADVAPDKLVEILVATVKEKNYELFKECIWPEYREVPSQLALLRYHWEILQEQFAKSYVYVEVFEVGPFVTVQGGTSGSAEEDFFTDEETKAEQAKHALPLVEECLIRIRVYDEVGRNCGGLPKPILLSRREKGRWYVRDGYPF